MSEQKDNGKWGKRGYAPDKPSDVAEWGDGPAPGKEFSEMTAEELARAEAGIPKLRKRIRDDL